MERYIGVGAHAGSCTLGIVGPRGKRLGSHVVETNACALIEVLRGISRDRHVCLEEGTLSGWLYEVLETRVYKGRGKFRRLGYVARAYGLVVRDVARVKNRLKSVLRSRGLGYGAGASVYAKRDR